MSISRIDRSIIAWANRNQRTWLHVSIATVFIWFGTLKLLGLSPAEGLVQDLFSATIHFMSFDTFYVLFSALEVLIGILFLIPHMERVVIPILFFHMVTTALPLFFLPSVAWTGFLVPTLVGQYIIKNLVIVAAAIGITANLKPLRK